MENYLKWFVVIVIVIVVLLVIKVISKLCVANNGCFSCLVGKTVIVTGANSGIGFYTAQDFAKRGARVILACRNIDRAEEAQTKIINSTGNVNISIEIIDFASLDSVRDFASRINANEERLDILVNNAGVILAEDDITKDGLSMLMQINYFGPFLLTLLLLDLLKKSQPSRIVNVSSLIAHFVKLDPNNLNHFSTTIFCSLSFFNYAKTKLCIILWTRELAKMLAGSGVTANSLHPGIISTAILRHTGIFVKLLYAIGQLICFKTAIEGAETSIYVAISKDIENISGEYFDNCKIARTPKFARHENLARQVWEVSENLTR